MEIDMKTREFSKAHFILLLGLCLSFLVIVPDELAWAGERNQTVPTVTPTDDATATAELETTATAEAAASATAEAEASATATETATATATSTATATGTGTATGTVTNTPFVLPTDIVDDPTGAGNLRTYIGIGLVLLLLFGTGVGSLIWWIIRRGRVPEE
jgi:hypothetical protein